MGEGGGTGAPSRLGAHSLTLTALVGAAYVLAYAFYLVLSRVLPTGEFALAGGYLAVLGIVTLGSAAVIFAAAKEVAAAPEGRPEARAAQVRAGHLRWMRWVAGALAAAAAGTALFSLEAALLLATCAVVPLRDLHCGLLNGLKRNGRFGVVVLVEACLRLALVGVAIWIPFAWVALAAWLLSYILGLGLAVALLPGAARARGDPAPVRTSTLESLSLRLPQVSFLNTDVLLVALIFGPGEATAAYVAAALLSRIPFYLVTPIAMGELPAMTKDRGGGPRTRRMIAVTALAGGGLIAPLLAMPGFALEVGFGPLFSSGAPALFFLGLTSFLLILVHALSLALFASGRGYIAGRAIAVAAIVEVAAIVSMRSGGSTAVIAAVTTLCAALALAPLAALHVRAARKWQSAD